jgi:hypothetical protein
MFTTKLKSVMGVMLVMAAAIEIGAGFLGYGKAAGQQDQPGRRLRTRPLFKWLLLPQAPTSENMKLTMTC